MPEGTATSLVIARRDAGGGVGSVSMVKGGDVEARWVPTRSGATDA